MDGMTPSESKAKELIHGIFDFTFLSPIDVTLEEWCARYSLKIKKAKCLQCEVIRATTIPAYGKTWRGLVAPKCECGFDGPFQHYVLKPNVEPPDLMRMFL